MLLEISIRNIALIDELTIEFSRGFNILTGETGAGKSIVVDSLSLVLGGRAGREMIRTGAQRGVVQALFDLADCPRAAEQAAQMGLICEDGLLTLSREISDSGRTLCRAAGVVVPLGALRELSALLMDLHGQHEHQALLNAHKHREFVDAYGGAEHAALRGSVARQYAQRMALAAKIKAALREQGDRERRLEEIDRRLEEIDRARLKPDEEAQIERRLAVLQNAERIGQSLKEAYALVYEGSGSAQEALSRAAQALEKIAPLDARYKDLAGRLNEAAYAVQDAGYELRDALEQVEGDPQTLEKLADRLDLIRRLEKRYGPSLSDVLEYAQALRTRREELSAGAADAQAWKRQLRQMDVKLKADCADLSAARQALAQKVAAGVTTHLGDLGMEKTRFEIRVAPARITAEGGDEVEMLISANPGEPLKPLSAIASGGEVSRVMLALKAVAVEEYGVASMVFDEIDTGVSGRMAQAVGEKMAMIAGRRQVLCVTHLPQIAALADRHFVVEKTQDAARTRTQVRMLDQEGRAREIARLIGGAEDAPSAMEHAANMLAAAARRKQALREAPKEGA